MMQMIFVATLNIDGVRTDGSLSKYYNVTFYQLTHKLLSKANKANKLVYFISNIGEH